jgi:hypothetical protein
VAESPDVRALRYLLSAAANGHRPVRCTGCPFARPYQVLGGRVTCDLLGGGVPVNHDRPPCTAEDWGERARIELDLLEADNAVLAAVASDAREESLMYRRGLAEGAAAERERCCGAVCDDCAAGGVPHADPQAGGRWRHADGRWCRADAIRGGAEGDGR